ncbi:hypothetical protein ACEQHX_000665 [Campylobacter lari]|uniref:beta family protein n=1 Tax=Campylobacter lari TaxID=201 RepID=UPI0021C0BF2C|nr:beta family protein [Campylobacter lari]
MEYVYFPVMKSRNSELKSYQELSRNIKNKILPIVELTRSRISKNNLNGSVDKKMEELSVIFSDHKFILDVTLEKTLSNHEISNLLDCKDGYRAWVNFVIKYKEKMNFIPCIHFNPQSLQEVLKQIDLLDKKFPILALRLYALDDDNRMYLDKIKNYLQKCVVILDAEDQDRNFDFLQYIKNIETDKAKAIVCVLSRFPSTVPIINNGEVGKYSLGKYFLFEDYQNVFYGDYALVCAKRYDMQARGWIPRIDIPIFDKNEIEFLYCRYRTSDKYDTEQAYMKCANTLYLDYRINFDDNENWGKKMVLEAKNGYVAGKNPSFWIAVRNNIYINQIACILEAKSKKLKLD